MTLNLKGNPVNSRHIELFTLSLIDQKMGQEQETDMGHLLASPNQESKATKNKLIFNDF